MNGACIRTLASLRSGRESIYGEAGEMLKWIVDRIPRPMIRVSLVQEKQGASWVEEREVIIEDEYRARIVWMSRRELERLDEFDGF